MVSRPPQSAPHFDRQTNRAGNVRLRVFASVALTGVLMMAIWATVGQTISGQHQFAQGTPIASILAASEPDLTGSMPVALFQDEEQGATPALVNAASLPSSPPQPARALDDDWPRFLGAAIDGKSSTKAIRTDWTGDGLPLRWAIKVGEGYGMGVVAAGRYFHFDRQKKQGRLRCIDMANGSSAWTFQYPSEYEDRYGYDAGPRSSPLVDGETVFLYGVEGILTAVDVSTGKKIWSVDLARKYGVQQNFFGVASNPVVDETSIYVMVGGSDEGFSTGVADPDSETPNGSAVIALNKRTGEERFTAGNDLASYTSLTWMPPNEQTDGQDGDVPRTLIAWARSAVWGIDPADGTIRFQFPWRSRKYESVNAATPVVDGNRIFISECYELGSALLEPSGGKCNAVWSDRDRRDKSLSAHFGTPVLHEGHLYGSSGRHAGSAELRCVEFATGKVKWKHRGYQRCSTTFVDGHLVVVGEQGVLALVKATPDAFTEVTRWTPNDATKEQGGPEFGLNPPCWAGAIIAGRSLLVRDAGKVACFDLTGPDE